MPVDYNDLEGLIFQNGDARQFYNELPKKIRDDISRHPEKINTYEKLKDYADSLAKDSE